MYFCKNNVFSPTIRRQVWLIEHFGLHESTRTHDGVGTETPSDSIHLLHEVDMLHRIVKEVDLVATLHQTTVLNTDETDELATLI